MARLVVVLLILALIFVNLLPISDARPFEKEEAPKNMPWFLKALYYMDLYHPNY